MMTLSSGWKSALVGIIGHDTIHNAFSQDLLRAPMRGYEGHTGVCEGADLQSPLGKA